MTDPSAAMLDICRERVAAAGIAERVTFHESYLDTLPAAAPFDAATCILVSQFLVDIQQRPNDIEEVIASASFERPVQIFQAALIRAWLTFRSRY